MPRGKDHALVSAGKGKGSTVMITLPRSARLRAVNQVPKLMDSRIDCSDLLGRLIHMVLALYLLPALLIVLVVGGVGMLVLMMGRLFFGPMRRSVG
jgi:nitrate reductase NapE component